MENKRLTERHMKILQTYSDRKKENRTSRQ